MGGLILHNQKVARAVERNFQGGTMSAGSPPVIRGIHSVLEKIAAALELPTGALIGAGAEGAESVGPGATPAEQSLAMAVPFARVDDPEARAECLAYVRDRGK